MIHITLDIDWAPDYIIDYVAELLIAKKVKATWFVTHQSAAIERLSKHEDLFELGIHPNFMVGSSHGSTPKEVLEHCLKVVPNAKSMRTHGLLDSTNQLREVLMYTNIEIDLSIYLQDYPKVEPFSYTWRNQKITRIPFIWEDDLLLERDNIKVEIEYLNGYTGFAIADFHPVHIYLNSHNMNNYNSLKSDVNDLKNASKSVVEKYRSEQHGIGNLFQETVDQLAKNGNSERIIDLYNKWKLNS